MMEMREFCNECKTVRPTEGNLSGGFRFTRHHRRTVDEDGEGVIILCPNSEKPVSESAPALEHA